jgi:phosphoenolpyruvate carboxylase
MELPKEEELPPELRELVQESGAILGAVIKREAGSAAFRAIENIRSGMAGLRDQEPEAVSQRLREELEALRKLTSPNRHTVAKAFTLFLELMNSCENAYRSLRLRERRPPPEQRQEALVYVLTAHPTEARAPENIAIFQGVQKVLLRGLEGGSWKEELRHQLELAWHAYPTRQRAPNVRDEAHHIYGTSLRPEILSLLTRETAPFYLRTWVGGDKDGHPGVNEKVMRESLSLSRGQLLKFALGSLGEVKSTLDLLPGKRLSRELKAMQRELASLRKLSPGDGGRVQKLKRALLGLSTAYEKELGALHPSLRDLRRLLHMFPALVMPLELREASDQLTSRDGSAPIRRMLRQLAVLARGGDPLWYVRGLIVSMTERLEHLVSAQELVSGAFGRPALPVIPLFETVASLEAGPGIVKALLRHPCLGECVRKHWGGRLEIMVGYSDSAKQGGVLPSRLAIATAMHKLEKVVLDAGVKPVFFQGSGGSVDRGGGSVQDQVAWWPRSALEVYKVTVQGEMVERSFSSPEIAAGQLRRIAESAGQALAREPLPPRSPALFAFAEEVRLSYEQMIRDPELLQVVSRATPYPFLSELKIGSRPSRRSKELTVEGLRAIPWVLCWTQSRVLFPTWWGVGAAWSKTPNRENLRAAYETEPVFRSYVKALGFTLAKVELPLWRIYLERSSLDPAVIERFYDCFQRELDLAWELVQFCSGSENPLWFRPWLGASIRLRSPIIHPLNLLQVLALEEGDLSLFRTTATGISAGMLTTG